MATTLGDVLAAARKEKRWSLREVERRTGINNAHLSQIETGGIERPAPNMLWALAEVYGLDLQDLLRLAGHVQAASAATPGSVVGAALRTMGDLTDDEQRQALKYMQELRKGRGPDQRHGG